MSTEDDIGRLILLVLGLAVLVLVVYAFVFSIPLIIVGFICYYLWHWRHNSPQAQERKAREHTNKLYEEAQAYLRAAERPSFDVMAADLLLELPRVPDGFVAAFAKTMDDLYDLEGFRLKKLPPPPLVCDSIEGARYRDYLIKVTSLMENTRLLEDAKTILAESLSYFLSALPQSAFAHQDEERMHYDMAVEHSFSDIGAVVHCIILPFYRDHTFANLRERLDRNLENVTLSARSRGDRLIFPEEYKGDDVVFAYLRGTPLLHLFNSAIPMHIPDETRFSHHWIVAPPGAGKSTTLQHLLKFDLDFVAENRASVVVMESNRDLIKSVERLKRFAPGGDLHGKLIVIDAEDVEFPLALNIFDLGLGSTEDMSARDREALRNSTIAMLDYIFRALLGAEMTSRQSTLFTFTIQLLLHIPNATLDTLIDIMQPKTGLAKYAHYITETDPDTQKFFDVKFNADEFRQTKAQVVDRLFAIKRIRALARMFSSKETKIDFFAELSTSKVILVNAARSLLQEDGVEIFGRFFLAMILLAAEKRQLLPKGERLPTFIYVDECQDIIRRDEKIPTFLDQARKNRVALVLAHQRLNQMSPSVLDALMGSTAIKFATRIANPGVLAKTMRTTPDFIADQPDFCFAAHVRGVTPTAVSLSVPFVDLELEEQMTDAEHATLIEHMRARYAVRQEDVMDTALDEEPGDMEPDEWG